MLNPEQAIYMTGRRGDTTCQVADDRRYATLNHLLTPDGEPALRREYDYVTIWEFWNGPDELLAAQDGRFYHAVNAKRAFANKLIPAQSLEELLELKALRLADAGFEDLNPKPDHLLISFDDTNKLVLGATGKLEVRLCNFEFVRRLPPANP